MRFGRVEISLPDWVEAVLPAREHVFANAEARMRLVIDLARQNVVNGTGGPFAAGVFERDGGRLLSVGVNLVVPAVCSIAHAEMVAIALAQRMLGHYDLGAAGLPACELVASTEPCAMCLGAVPWSGVRRLLCGARDEDARSVGFDEGHKPADWPEALAARGIAVVRDVCRDEALAVLEQYAASGGTIYNPRRSG